MPPLDNLTLRERVHDHLKRAILANRYAPGTELLEVPLADELGVSRGPVREALRSLESEGLVRITPRRGAVVASFTKRDFLDAYQVREALEALAVRLAVPRLEGSALDELEERIERMDAHARDADQDAFFDANRAFHEAIVEASGNGVLVETYRRLISRMGPYRRPSARLRGNLARSITEHRAIVIAKRARDVERAVELALHHIRVPQDRIDALSEEAFAAEARAGQVPPGGSTAS